MIQVHPTAIPGRGQTPAHERIGARRGRARLGAAEEGGQSAATRDPEKRAVVLPGREVPRVRQHRAPRHRDARDLRRVREPGHGRERREPGVPRPDAQGPDYLKKKLGGILEIYEKFVGEDPYSHEPMKIFPAVHYTMGGLWTQYTKGSYTRRRRSPSTSRARSRPCPSPTSGRACSSARRTTCRPTSRGLRLRRGQLRVPRRQPLGRQRAALVHLRRLVLRRVGVELREGTRPEQEPGGEPARSLVRCVPRAEQAKAKRLLDTPVESGGKSRPIPYIIGKELGDEMTAACTVVRTEPSLKQCLGKLASSRIVTRDASARRRGVDQPVAGYARAGGRHAGAGGRDRAHGALAARKAAGRTIAPTIRNATTRTS
jgi:succinate dehydrogenase / fumarate reductase flavoprotein subunit